MALKFDQKFSAQMAYDPILIVEDNYINQLLILKILEILGYPDCIWVDNGADAVRACKKLPFALILMDLRMPGMDGLQATEIIQQDHSLVYKPHIVALTTDNTQERMKACFKAGMKDFLVKPADIKSIYACIVNAYKDWLSYFESKNIKVSSLEHKKRAEKNVDTLPSS